MKDKNGKVSYLKLLGTIIVLAVAVGIAWGTVYNQVIDNTTAVCEVKKTADANKECIIRLETQLEGMQKTLTIMQKDMKTGFSELTTLVRSKEWKP